MEPVPVESDDGCPWWLVGIQVTLVAAFASLMFYAAGRGAERTKWMDAAAAAGHAEYYLDEHNTRRWRWRSEK